jgi:hypothetical protein
MQSVVRADARKNFKKYILFFLINLVVVAGWKRERKISVFNPQDPRASRAKPQEEGFFGLVLLVTHPSSIPLLGGLIPKSLSLSLHSL